MSTRDIIPPTLSDLLVNLSYIASIPRQKKACFNNLSYVDATSWVGAYKRHSLGEGRKKMLIKINQIIDQAIEDIDKYEGTQYLSLLVSNLSNTEVGINNLIATYQDDPNVIMQLQVCKTKIELKLKPHLKLIDRSFPSRKDEGRKDEISGGQEGQLPKEEKQKLEDHGDDSDSDAEL